MTSPGNPVPLQSFPLSFSLSLSHSLFFSRLDGGGGLSLSLTTVSSQVLFFSLFPSGDKEKREGERETNEIKKKEKKRSHRANGVERKLHSSVPNAHKEVLFILYSFKEALFFWHEKEMCENACCILPFPPSTAKKGAHGQRSPLPPPTKDSACAPSNQSLLPPISLFFFCSTRSLISRERRRGGLHKKKKKKNRPRGRENETKIPPPPSLLGEARTFLWSLSLSRSPLPPSLFL